MTKIISSFSPEAILQKTSESISYSSTSSSVSSSSIFQEGIRYYISPEIPFKATISGVTSTVRPGESFYYQQNSASPATFSGFDSFLYLRKYPAGLQSWFGNPKFIDNRLTLSGNPDVDFELQGTPGEITQSTTFTNYDPGLSGRSSAVATNGTNWVLFFETSSTQTSETGGRYTTSLSGTPTWTISTGLPYAYVVGGPDPSEAVFGANAIVVVGTDGNVHRSTNGGVSFSSVSSSAGFGTADVWHISFVNNRFFATGSARMATSTDGASWSTCTVPVSNLGEVSWDGSAYYCPTTSGVIKTTTANGTSGWTLLSGSPKAITTARAGYSGSCPKVLTIGSRLIFFGGDQINSIYTSTNGGTSWTDLYPELLDANYSLNNLDSLSSLASPWLYSVANREQTAAYNPTTSQFIYGSSSGMYYSVGSTELSSITKISFTAHPVSNATALA